MRIGFGGIGKGYAAERARLVMKSLGVKSGIVNASGDLTTWGLQPNGKPWTIGIVNPNAAHELFSYLNVTDLAVATSGNYEKYCNDQWEEVFTHNRPKDWIAGNGHKKCHHYYPQCGNRRCHGHTGNDYGN